MSCGSAKIEDHGVIESSPSSLNHEPEIGKCAQACADRGCLHCLEGRCVMTCEDCYVCCQWNRRLPSVFLAVVAVWFVAIGSILAITYEGIPSTAFDDCTRHCGIVNATDFNIIEPAINITGAGICKDVKAAIDADPKVVAAQLIIATICGVVAPIVALYHMSGGLTDFSKYADLLTILGGATNVGNGLYAVFSVALPLLRQPECVMDAVPELRSVIYIERIALAFIGFGLLQLIFVLPLQGWINKCSPRSCQPCRACCNKGSCRECKVLCFKDCKCVCCEEEVDKRQARVETVSCPHICFWWDLELESFSRHRHINCCSCTNDSGASATCVCCPRIESCTCRFCTTGNSFFISCFRLVCCCAEEKIGKLSYRRCCCSLDPGSVIICDSECLNPFSWCCVRRKGGGRSCVCCTPPSEIVDTGRGCLCCAPSFTSGKDDDSGCGSCCRSSSCSCLQACGGGRGGERGRNGCLCCSSSDPNDESGGGCLCCLSSPSLDGGDSGCGGACPSACSCFGSCGLCGPCGGGGGDGGGSSLCCASSAPGDVSGGGCLGCCSTPALDIDGGRSGSCSCGCFRSCSGGDDGGCLCCSPPSLDSGNGRSGSCGCGCFRSCSGGGEGGGDGGCMCCSSPSLGDGDGHSRSCCLFCSPPTPDGDPGCCGSCSSPSKCSCFRPCGGGGGEDAPGSCCSPSVPGDDSGCGNDCPCGGCCSRPSCSCDNDDCCRCCGSPPCESNCLNPCSWCCFRSCSRGDLRLCCSSCPCLESSPNSTHLRCSCCCPRRSSGMWERGFWILALCTISAGVLCLAMSSQLVASDAYDLCLICEGIANDTYFGTANITRGCHLINDIDSSLSTTATFIAFALVSIVMTPILSKLLAGLSLGNSGLLYGKPIESVSLLEVSQLPEIRALKVANHVDNVKDKVTVEGVQRFSKIILPYIQTALSTYLDVKPSKGGPENNGEAEEKEGKEEKERDGSNTEDKDKARRKKAIAIFSNIFLTEDSDHYLPLVAELIRQCGIPKGPNPSSDISSKAITTKDSGDAKDGEGEVLVLDDSHGGDAGSSSSSAPILAQPPPPPSISSSSSSSPTASSTAPATSSSSATPPSSSSSSSSSPSPIATVLPTPPTLSLPNTVTLDVAPEALAEAFSALRRYIQGLLNLLTERQVYYVQHIDALLTDSIEEAKKLGNLITAEDAYAITELKEELENWLQEENTTLFFRQDAWNQIIGQVKASLTEKFRKAFEMSDVLKRTDAERIVEILVSRMGLDDNGDPQPLSSPSSPTEAAGNGAGNGGMPTLFSIEGVTEHVYRLAAVDGWSVGTSITKLKDTVSDQINRNLGKLHEIRLEEQMGLINKSKQLLEAELKALVESLVVIVMGEMTEFLQLLADSGYFETIEAFIYKLRVGLLQDLLGCSDPLLKKLNELGDVVGPVKHAVKSVLPPIVTDPDSLGPEVDPSYVPKNKTWYGSLLQYKRLVVFLPGGAGVVASLVAIIVQLIPAVSIAVYQGPTCLSTIPRYTEISIITFASLGLLCFGWFLLLSISSFAFLVRACSSEAITPERQLLRSRYNTKSYLSKSTRGNTSNNNITYISVNSNNSSSTNGHDVSSSTNGVHTANGNYNKDGAATEEKREEVSNPAVDKKVETGKTSHDNTLTEDNGNSTPTTTTTANDPHDSVDVLVVSQDGKDGNAVSHSNEAVERGDGDITSKSTGNES